MLKTGTKPKKYDYCGACTFYLGAIIVTLICQALAGVVSAALAVKYPNISRNGDFNTAFMIVVQLFNLLFIFLFGKLRSYSFACPLFKSGNGVGVKGYKIGISDFAVPIVAAALLMAAMYLPTVWYGYFTQYALGIPPETGNIDLSTASSVVMIVIASVFLAPVCEETIYRGVLYCGLAQRFPARKAIPLAALAFMLMHMNPVQVVFQFALGVSSAYMLYRSGRLFPSVLFHAAANALALVVQLTPMNAALVGCEQWLVNNIAAAVFITLGFFVAGGGALYALLRFGFSLQRKDNAAAEENRANDSTLADAPAPAPDGDNVQKVIKDQMVADMRKKEGTFRFCIAIGICAVMFVLNLIVSML